VLEGLLLDFGSVVFKSPFEQLGRLERELGLAPGTIRRHGPFDPAGDAPWQEMLAGEITEREYWADFAAEVGLLVGEDWNVLKFISVLAGGPEEEFIRPEALALVDDARKAGIPTGILTNELELFHGREWMARITILAVVDVIVDASVTGILKPDPASYHMAVDRLGCDPGKTVFVDDQPHNVAGAVAAGLIAIHLDITDPSPAFDETRVRLGLTERIPQG